MHNNDFAGFKNARENFCYFIFDIKFFLAILHDIEQDKMATKSFRSLMISHGHVCYLMISYER